MAGCAREGKARLLYICGRDAVEEGYGVQKVGGRGKEEGKVEKEGRKTGVCGVGRVGSILYMGGMGGS